MQKVSFKAADYSQLYKVMEKIRVVREEKIIPKEKGFTPIHLQRNHQKIHHH